MPCFNGADFISEEIESVISQYYFRYFEILVGDDCSTDDSLYPLVVPMDSQFAGG